MTTALDTTDLVVALKALSSSERHALVVGLVDLGRRDDGRLRDVWAALACLAADVGDDEARLFRLLDNDFTPDAEITDEDDVV